MFLSERLTAIHIMHMYMHKTKSMEVKTSTDLSSRSLEFLLVALSLGVMYVTHTHMRT